MVRKLLAAFAALTLLSGCGTDAPEITIDYGTSELYNRSDMDEAIALIRKTFASFKGGELHTIRYTDDSCNSEENLTWMNSLGKHAPYAQCICFQSEFHSSKENSGSWTPDYEYKDWEWWLARTEGGKWEMLTWGY